jgi:stage II sporulation protein D
VLILYNGQPITASYFSSSGGATDNSENVWVQARPYLRSVHSITEFAPMQWERTFTWAQLTTLAANANARIGNVTGVTLSTSYAGRVQELTLTGTNGTHSITSERIRTFFTTQGGALPSRNFHANQQAPLPTVWVFDGHQTVQAPLSSFMRLDWNHNTAAIHAASLSDGRSVRRMDAQRVTISGGTGVTFTGAGWGHGVGMSQHGAQGMALAGFTYREILKHYYTNVEVTAR